METFLSTSCQGTSFSCDFVSALLIAAAAGMGSTLLYLLIGSLFSAGTSVLWILWSRCEESLKSCIFQHVADAFALSAHSFKDVTNMPTITRILEHLHLRTHTYLWQHDANIDGNDRVMTGYVRLPAQSWFLWILSLFGISHYVWVNHDAREIVFVGPTDFIMGVLRASNTYTNRAIPPAELERLHALLHEPALSNHAERRCVRCERCFLAAGQMALLVCTACSSQIWHFKLALWMTLMGWGYFCWYKYCRPLRNADNWSPLLRASTAPDTRGPADMEPEQHAPDDDDYRALPNDANEVHDSPAPNEAYTDTTRYSLVISRGPWFEIPVVFDKAPCAGVKIPSLHMHAGEQSTASYAVPLHREMLDSLLAQVTTNCVLYVCMHNPMVDCPLQEMRELTKKTQQTVALVVLLPPLEELDAALSRPSVLRVNGGKETRYVATYCDFSLWLSVMTSGIFAHIALVFPYKHEATLKTSAAWACAGTRSSTYILT